jgi:predicted Ser/Thr protein kinase
VPPSALGGLCPECLMKLGVATQTDAGGGAGPRGTRVAPSPPARPEEIAKHFPQLEILACLGRGGMGVVYKARQPRLDRLVALKILAPEREQDPKFAERFEREAKALARLSHPNIVAVHDFGEADGLFYLLMEYVDGVTLRQLLQTRKIAPEEAFGIVPKICDALQYAHELGVVHRDIKPENVLLDKQGRVKIADFGIAKIMAAGGLPASADSGNIQHPTSNTQPPINGPMALTQDQVVGTPHYMAPEQVEKPQLVDHRADIYSLGVVFYEMLTGELPLGKFAAPSTKVHVDVRLDEVVLHALEKEPARRYQHASEVKTAVETIATSAANPAAPPPVTAKPAMPGALWITVILLALLIPAKLLATPSMGMRAAVDAIVFGVLLTGVLLRARWAYALAPARCAFNVFDVAAHGVHATGVLSAVPSASFLLGALVTDVLIAVPVLLSPGWFFTRRQTEQDRRRWLWWTVGASVAAALAGMINPLSPVRLHGPDLPFHDSAASPAVSAPQLTQEGWQLWQSRQWSEAAGKFSMAVSMAPDNAEAWNGLGWANFNSGKYAEAEKAFNRTIALEANHPAARNGLGQLYLAQKQYGLAETNLLKAASRAPAAWYGLARLYLLQGRFDQAEEWASKVVDSGQGDQVAPKMLEAARAKRLPPGLRFVLEPQPAVNVESPKPKKEGSL